MKKKILKTTLALTVILAGFFNSAKFSKVISSDVNLASLFSIAIANGECFTCNESNSQNGITYGQVNDGEYDRSYITYTGGGCWIDVKDYGDKCVTASEVMYCEYSNYYSITCG